MERNEIEFILNAILLTVVNEGEVNTSKEVLLPKAEKKRGKLGGITCCVPGCFNNSKRHKDIRFYVILKDKKLRAIWLSKISRKGFAPSEQKNGHRVRIFT